MGVVKDKRQEVTMNRYDVIAALSAVRVECKGRKCDNCRFKGSKGHCFFEQPAEYWNPQEVCKIADEIITVADSIREDAYKKYFK